jgi:hypothetical protein
MTKESTPPLHVSMFNCFIEGDKKETQIIEVIPYKKNSNFDQAKLYDVMHLILLRTQLVFN